jgi:hypothetical protein
MDKNIKKQPKHQDRLFAKLIAHLLLQQFIEEQKINIAKGKLFK